MKIFESVRAGNPRRYEIQDEALVYKTSTAGKAEKTVVLNWVDIEKIITDNGNILYFVPKKLKPRRQKLAIWLDDSQIKSFLQEAMQAWGKKDWSRATKVAFDYGADDRAAGWVMLVLSIAFPVLLATLLLSDGLHTLKCNRLLAANTKTAQAQLVKITKDRRGNWIWKLEFQTDQGTTVSGKRAAFVYDERGKPTAPINVAYSADDLSCWDIEIQQAASGQTGLNSSNRHFNILMDLGFGSMFGLLGLIATVLSIARIRRKRPFKEVLKEAGTQLMARRPS